MLLKKYAERFKGAPLQATYAYLRSWATDNLPVNPLVSHETKISHLRDASFLSRALKCALVHAAVVLALRRPRSLEGASRWDPGTSNTAPPAAWRRASMALAGVHGVVCKSMRARKLCVPEGGWQLADNLSLRSQGAVPGTGWPAAHACAEAAQARAGCPSGPCLAAADGPSCTVQVQGGAPAAHGRAEAAQAHAAAGRLPGLEQVPGPPAGPGQGAHRVHHLLPLLPGRAELPGHRRAQVAQGASRPGSMDVLGAAAASRCLGCRLLRRCPPCACLWLARRALT